MELSAEEQLQKAMMDTYHLNLLFLSEFDNELFLRINGLSDLIGSEEYKERYFLEFLKEKGDFDIYDSNEDRYLYNKDPKKFNNKAVIQTNFDLQNSINTLHADIFNQPIVENIKILEDDPVFTVASKNMMKDIFALKKEIDYKVERSNRKVNSIDKFIFVGTLLGRHIPKIMKKINAKTFLVCESNLEIFRLSLFVCDYSSMAVDGKKVVFSVMDDDEIIMKKVLDFYNMDVYNNALLKFYSTNYQVDRYFDRIIDRVLSLSPMSFNYYMHLDNVVYNLTENFFRYNTLSLNKNIKIDAFKNKKILYLGAGPSLSENIKWIKENQDKFVIVTMAASLTILFANDIKPDIITTLDPQEIVSDQFFKNEKSLDYLKDAIVLASLNTHKSTLKKLSKITTLYMYEVLGSIQENQIPLLGNSVGEMTFSIISRFTNINEIYFLGIDLALNQDTGSTHSADYEYKSSLEIKKENVKFEDNYSYRENIITIKGNLKNEVLTSRLFYGSLRFYNHETANYNLPIYNMSTHGAFINNTIPLSIDDLNVNNFDLINKLEFSEKLKEGFSSIVVKEFEGNIISNHILLVEEIISLITKVEKIKTYEELNIFSNEIFVHIMNNSKNSHFLKEVYVSYTLIFNPYISYCMLVKNKKDKISINKIFILWKEKLLELLIRYNSYMKNLIK